MWRPNMTYANGRVVHDADSHVMETRDWLEPFADARPAERSRLFGRGIGPIDGLWAAAEQRRADAEATAKAAADPIAGPKGWSAYGAFDRDERAHVLDTLGFSQQLVFPTAGLGPVRTAKTPEERYAASRAYNRAIAAFCAD